MIKTIATIEGRARGLVWMKINPPWSTKCLTLPDNTLPHGTKSADEVYVDVDPDSLYHDGRGYIANVKVTGVKSRTTEV